MNRSSMRTSNHTKPFTLFVSNVMILVMLIFAVGCTSTSDVENEATPHVSEESLATGLNSEESYNLLDVGNAYVVNIFSGSDNSLKITLNGEELTSGDAVKEDDGDLKLKAAVPRWVTTTPVPR